MLFYLDESWQKSIKGTTKVGVLSAAQIKAHDFNELSKAVYQLKVKHLGYEAGNCEIKGKHMFRKHVFDLEEKRIASTQLNLARDILELLRSRGVNLFASVVFAKEEIDLSCADENNLDRPFFFLFERINLFMEENYPDHSAHRI